MTTAAFERVQTARHPDRPYAMDLFSEVFSAFMEIHGDRRYADDPVFTFVKTSTRLFYDPKWDQEPGS